MCTDFLLLIAWTLVLLACRILFPIAVAMVLAALADVPWESEVTTDSTQGLLCGLELSLDIGVIKSERVFWSPRKDPAKTPSI